MGTFHLMVNCFLVLLSIQDSICINPQGHQPDRDEQRKQQQQGNPNQNQNQQGGPGPESRNQAFSPQSVGQNGIKPGSAAREFNAFTSLSNRFNPQNSGPFSQRESSGPSVFNRTPFPALGGSGRGFVESGLMGGPSSRAMMESSLMAGSNRHFDFNMMANQALLGASNLRQLEQALHARAQLMGAGIGGGRAGFGFPANGGAQIDFAASQLDPVSAFVRPFFPTPRQDSSYASQVQSSSPYGASIGRPVNVAAINYDASVPQYRRPGEPQADSQYAMQYPFASVSHDPKISPVVGYAKPLKAVVVLTSPFGVSGIFNLTQSGVDQPVEIRGRVTGLRPGDHGIHIHTLGDLGRSCDSAGSHFNPEGVHHGSPEDIHNQPHAGDLGNIYAGDYGPAEFIISTPMISLYPPAPTFVIGRTLVIHEKPDDLGRGGDQQSRETGNSGSRIACGIIGISL